MGWGGNAQLNEMMGSEVQLGLLVKWVTSEHKRRATFIHRVHGIWLFLSRPGLCGGFQSNIWENHSVVPLPQESMDNCPSLFDYRMNNLYDNLINDFDPYLEYGEGYQNKMAFKDAFYG